MSLIKKSGCLLLKKSERLGIKNLNVNPFDRKNSFTD